MREQISPERASNNQRRRRRLIMRLGAEQDDLCFYCDKPVDYPDPDIRYDNRTRNQDNVASFDHVIPRSKNGRNGPNLIIAHRYCNSSRDIFELTEEQSEKLAALNERRKYLFDEQAGKTHPSTFGAITWASIVLAEKVDDEETPHRSRTMICKFCQRYARLMRSLKKIEDSGEWQYLSGVVLTDFLQRLETGDFLYKTYIASILKAIRQDYLARRYRLHTWTPIDFTDNKD